MTKHAINDIDGVLDEIDTLVAHYSRQRDNYDEKGKEKMAVSYQGSVLGLLMLKAHITGEELEQTKWWR